MRCEDRAQNLLLYLHNALGPLERVHVQWHLARCANCRKTLAAMDETSAAMRRAIGTGPQVGLSVARIWPVVVGAIVVAAVAFLLWQSPPHQTPALIARHFGGRDTCAVETHVARHAEPMISNACKSKHSVRGCQ